MRINWAIRNCDEFHLKTIHDFPGNGIKSNIALTEKKH